MSNCIELRAGPAPAAHVYAGVGHGRGSARKVGGERRTLAKTVEGSLLGLAGALGAAALMRFAFLPEAAPVYYAASLAVALAGCAGDLAASALKRAAGSKDFGRVLPGHGGIMDRLDSLLFAVPVGYVAVNMFQRH